MDPQNLSRDEHQEIVLMLGSKKEWAIYLGMDDKTATSIWNSLGLVPPTTWWKAISPEEQVQLLSRHGSIAALAAHISVSESFLRPFFIPPKIVPEWDEDTTISLFEKYRSVRLVARMTNCTEAAVRKRVEELDLEIADLIDYSTGGHSNAKGRRAELDFARLRGEKVLVDRNKVDGSQARWDFDDADLGRVNVKASRRYRYKARTRKGDPDFWKVSTAGREDCDYFAFLCYDEKMTALMGYVFVRSSEVAATKSIQLQKGNLVTHGLHPDQDT